MRKSLLDRLQGWIGNLRLWRHRTEQELHWHDMNKTLRAEPAGAAQVVSRALCRYRFFQWPETREADRESAMRMNVIAWSPFANSEFAICPAKDGWMVFAWDGGERLERCRAVGIPAGGKIVPEPCWWRQPEDGVYLWRTRSGIDGQIWRDGAMIASRWWQQMPSEQDWANFERVIGEGNLNPLPTVGRPLWEGSPWSGLRAFERLGLHSRKAWYWLLAASALLLLGLTGALLKQDMEMQMAIKRDRASLEERRRLLAPLISSREAALSNMTKTIAWQAVTKRPPVGAMLADILRRLPSDGTILREAEFANGEWRLLLQISAGSSRIAYIRALEASPLLANVRERAAEYGIEGIVLLARWNGALPEQAQAAQEINDSERDNIDMPSGGGKDR